MCRVRKYAAANLYTRASAFIGDRHPREHEFSIQQQLFDLSDDLVTRITAVFYSDAREAFIKAIADA